MDPADVASASSCPTSRASPRKATVEEALEMARDAIEGYLEIMRDEGWPVPTVRRERIAVEAA
jgi:predicted RNase H-like HicB family nuclease